MDLYHLQFTVNTHFIQLGNKGINFINNESKYKKTMKFNPITNIHKVINETAGLRVFLIVFLSSFLYLSDLSMNFYTYILHSYLNRLFIAKDGYCTC